MSTNVTSVKRTKTDAVYVESFDIHPSYAKWAGEKSRLIARLDKLRKEQIEANYGPVEGFADVAYSAKLAKRFLKIENELGQLNAKMIMSAHTQDGKLVPGYRIANECDMGPKFRFDAKKQVMVKEKPVKPAKQPRLRKEGNLPTLEQVLAEDEKKKGRPRKELDRSETPEEPPLKEKEQADVVESWEELSREEMELLASWEEELYPVSEQPKSSSVVDVGGHEEDLPLPIHTAVAVVEAPSDSQSVVQRSFLKQTEMERRWQMTFYEDEAWHELLGAHNSLILRPSNRMLINGKPVAISEDLRHRSKVKELDKFIRRRLLGGYNTDMAPASVVMLDNLVHIANDGFVNVCVNDASSMVLDAVHNMVAFVDDAIFQEAFKNTKMHFRASSDEAAAAFGRLRNFFVPRRFWIDILAPRVFEWADYDRLSGTNWTVCRHKGADCPCVFKLMPRRVDFYINVVPSQVEVRRPTFLLANTFHGRGKTIQEQPYLEKWQSMDRPAGITERSIHYYVGARQYEIKDVARLAESGAFDRLVFSMWSPNVANNTKIYSVNNSQYRGLLEHIQPPTVFRWLFDDTRERLPLRAEAVINLEVVDSAIQMYCTHLKHAEGGRITPHDNMQVFKKLLSKHDGVTADVIVVSAKEALLRIKYFEY